MRWPLRIEDRKVLDSAAGCSGGGGFTPVSLQRLAYLIDLFLYRSGMEEVLLASTGWSAGGLLMDRAGRRVAVGRNCGTGVEREVRTVGR